MKTSPHIETLTLIEACLDNAHQYNQTENNEAVDELIIATQKLLELGKHLVQQCVELGKQT